MNRQKRLASIEMDAKIVFAVATNSLEHMVKIGALGEHTVLSAMDRFTGLPLQNKPYGDAVVARAAVIEEEAYKRLAEEGKKINNG
jgi:hypothetical protein